MRCCLKKQHRIGFSGGLAPKEPYFYRQIKLSQRSRCLTLGQGRSAFKITDRSDQWNGKQNWQSRYGPGSYQIF